MKFPVSWLREHVDIGIDSGELAERLTLAGVEVEEVVGIGGALEGVVVAEVTACEPHPEADRLRVCRVSTGSGEVTVVCGAPNVRPGLKAALARPGAVLADGRTIGVARLRGVESHGMLCSARELGLDEDAAGLLELAPEAEAGIAVGRHLGLPDARFELKPTPDRADCLSVRGIAFEVAAVLGSRIRPMEIADVHAESAARIALEIDEGADCPLYCGRVIEDVDTAARTPAWIAERLRRSGVRPVGLLVDVTQYVMLELGQPLHAFDFDRLRGPVGVRRGRPGESLQLLDGRTAQLDERFVLVTDADRPVAVAGISGGMHTRVTPGTRRVFLESAHFAPHAVAGRARALGLHTDAAHRFERGVDPGLPRLALERATALVLEAAGGRAGPVVTSAPSGAATARPAVTLRREGLSRLLGLDIADAEVERILGALGMDVASDHDGWRVTPPGRRFDISIEEDLIEEVARIHGYDRIPEHLPAGPAAVTGGTEQRLDETDIRRQLVARDYVEAIEYAFVDAACLETWGMAGATLALTNPISAELAVMRPSLLPGLVAALQRNGARQQRRVRLFELGRVFQAASGGEVAPSEVRRIAAVACGSVDAEQWGDSRRLVDFHDIKGDLESVYALAGDDGPLQLVAGGCGWLHPGRSAAIHRGSQRLGWIGQLHPAVAARLGLDVDVLVFELDLELLQERTLPRAAPLSRFPSVRQDIAVVVPESTTWASLRDCVQAALGSQLRELVLFDVYRGKGLEPGTKSLAMGLILQDVSRTLGEQDIDRARMEAIAALESMHSATIRG